MVQFYLAKQSEKEKLYTELALSCSEPVLCSLLCSETDSSIRVGKQDYMFILTDFKK